MLFKLGVKLTRYDGGFSFSNLENDKVFYTNVSILEIQTLGIFFLEMFPSLFLLLPGKHCIEKIQVFMKGKVVSLVVDGISKVLLTSDKWFVDIRDDLSRTGWNLSNRPTGSIVFSVIFFTCSAKFSLTSYVNPRCFWDILFFKGMSLNGRQGCSSFLVLPLNITSCTCLVKSGLKIIFHWKAQ